MPPEAFAALVAGWTGGTPPRVWSLLVTVFGDMAQAPGQHLSGAALRALLEPVGITPQATRTALHRLKKDGWIESQRDGRETTYGLSASGRAQSRAASPRIYGKGQQAGRAWLLVAPPGADWPPDAVPIAQGTALSPRAPQSPDIFGAEINARPPLPDWFRERTASAELCAASRDLSQRLTALRTSLAQVDAPDPTQSSILRVLIVHDWRRIALRAPLLPSFVMPMNWQGDRAQEQVHAVLDTLPTPAENGTDIATVHPA